MATDELLTATEAARRSLARFELAAIRRRNAVRLRLGVSDDELTTLLHLLEHPRLTQGELISISTLSRSGVGAMVHRLEDAGLIERRPDPGDRRVRLLELSPRGTRRIREACGAGDDALARLLAERPDDELLALARLLSSLADATRGDTEPEPAPVSARPDWRMWG